MLNHNEQLITVNGCVGMWKSPSNGTTAVFPTTDERYAVVRMDGMKVLKCFDGKLHARRYNALIHGQRLGE